MWKYDFQQKKSIVYEKYINFTELIDSNVLTSTKYHTIDCIGTTNY